MAEAFDTLEHIQDLCWDRDLHQTQNAMAETFALLRALHFLTESLTSQCAIAMADTISPASPTATFDQLWHCFEIERVLAEIKCGLLNLSAEDSDRPFDALALLASSLKTALKKLDQ